MKSGWDRYASNKKLVQKGYFRKYSVRKDEQVPVKGKSEDEVLRDLLIFTPSKIEEEVNVEVEVKLDQKQRKSKKRSQDRDCKSSSPSSCRKKET